MENQEKCSTEKGWCKCGGGWHGHAWWHILIKLIIGVGLLVLAFCAGAAVGFFHGGGMGYRHMQYSDGMGVGGMGGMDEMMYGKMGKLKGGGDRWSFFDGEENDDFYQVFGTVTKIEGTKITIFDNGGKERVVFSESETLIVSSRKEAGLSALKTGQVLKAVGTLDKDNQLHAHWIQISGI